MVFYDGDKISLSQSVDMKWESMRLTQNGVGFRTQSSYVLVIEGERNALGSKKFIVVKSTALEVSERERLYIEAKSGKIVCNYLGRRIENLEILYTKFPEIGNIVKDAFLLVGNHDAYFCFTLVSHRNGFIVQTIFDVYYRISF